MKTISFVMLFVLPLSAGTILRTTDGGETWQREYSGTAGNLAGVCVDIFTGSVLAVGDRGAILRRGLGGIWEDVSPEGFRENLVSVAIGAGGVAMACGSRGALLSSFNGGATWRVWDHFDSGGVDLLSVNLDPTSPELFVITGENGFVHTASSGRAEPVSSSDVTGSCVRLCGGEPQILVRTDDLPGSPFGDIVLRSVTPLVSAGSPCTAVGERGVVFRYGQGEWIRSESPVDADLNGVACLVFGEVLCAVGDGGVIIVSRDNGESWTAVESGVSVNLHGVAGNGAGVGYIVGDGPFGRFFP